MISFWTGQRSEAHGPQMNFLDRRSSLLGLLAFVSYSDPEKNLKEQELQTQELRKNLRVPKVRWGGMRAGENTQAGKIVELHSGEEIGRPFGPPLPRSAD